MKNQSALLKRSLVFRAFSFLLTLFGHRSRWSAVVSFLLLGAAFAGITAFSFPYSGGKAETNQPTHQNNTPVNAAAALMPMWSQLGLDIDGEAAGDQSGFSVSMSSDGSRVAVGAPFNDGNGSSAGHVRIYQYNSVSETWSQMGSDIDGTAANEQFGWSVSMSSDGNRVAIGVPFGGPLNRGYVNIYGFDSGAGTWTQLGSIIEGESVGDQFGISVSMNNDGSRVAIGAIGADATAAANAGHVRIFDYDSASDEWNQAGGKINGEAGSDSSGYSVSLSSDGSRVAIGAYLNDGTGTNAGHVRVYEFSSGTWSQLGSDIDGENAADRSGWSVSMNADGSRVAIGAYRNDGAGSDAGHVRIYEFDSGSWSQVGADIDGEAVGDESGYSVSLSSDGSKVAIGAYLNDGADSDAGHVRIYEFASGTWSQVGADIDGETVSDRSGWSVSMSSDGSQVAIGALNNDDNGSQAGHVRVYAFFTPNAATISACDNGNGTGNFTLTDAENIANGDVDNDGADGSTDAVTYHNSEVNANANTGVLPDGNNLNPATNEVWARIVNDGTPFVQQVTLSLFANPVVQINGGNSAADICEGSTTTVNYALTLTTGENTGASYTLGAGSDGDFSVAGTNLNFDPTSKTSGTYSATVDVTDGNGCMATSVSFTVEIVADPVAPTLLAATPANGSTVCSGATVKATTNPGSGGTGTCTDEYQFSVDGGSTYSPYTPGNDITAGNSGNVIIQARRLCDGADCDGTGELFATIAQWPVNPQPVGAPSSLTETLCTGDIPVTVVNVTDGDYYIITNITTSTNSTSGGVSGVSNNTPNQVKNTGEAVETQALSNNGNSFETVIYSITPYSNGADGNNDNGTGDDCSGTPFDVVITVEPTPELDVNNITLGGIAANPASVTTASQSYTVCSGDIIDFDVVNNYTAAGDLQRYRVEYDFNATNLTVTNNQTDNTVADGFVPNQLYTQPVSLTPVNNGTTNQIVNVRLTPYTELEGNEDLGPGDCQRNGADAIIGEVRLNFTVLPNPVGRITNQNVATNAAITSQPVCSDSDDAAVANVEDYVLFSSINADVRFKVEVTSTDPATPPAGFSDFDGTTRFLQEGDALDDNGNIVNTSGETVTVNYSITPYLSGPNGTDDSASGDDCLGTPFNFSFDIDPEPLAADSAEEICSDEAITVNLQDNVDDTDDGGNGVPSDFAWEITEITGGTVTGAAETNMGTGDQIVIAVNGINNVSEDPAVITYTVTPTAETGDCEGATFEVVLTVNPEPVAADETPQTVCSNEAYSIPLLDNDDGNNNVAATFTYTVTASGGATPPPARTTPNADPITGPNTASGTSPNDIVAGSYTNTSGAAVVLTYTVTPISAEDCEGATFEAEVTVNPEPVLATAAEVCSGVEFIFDEAELTTNGVPSEYTWTVTANANVTGKTDGTDEATFTQTLTNITNVPQDVVYTVTPTSDAGCEGNQGTFTVTVEPTPDLSVTGLSVTNADTPGGFALDPAVVGDANNTGGVVTGVSQPYTICSGDEIDFNVVKNYTSNTAGSERYRIEYEFGTDVAIIGQTDGAFVDGQLYTTNGSVSFTPISVNTTGTETVTIKLTPYIENGTTAGALNTGEDCIGTDPEITLTFIVSPPPSGFVTNNGSNDPADAVTIGEVCSDESADETASALAGNVEDIVLGSELTGTLFKTEAEISTPASGTAPTGFTGFSAADQYLEIGDRLDPDGEIVNQSDQTVVITYTITPYTVGADGEDDTNPLTANGANDDCLGAPFTYTLTIKPEPVLADNLSKDICSDVASGIILVTDPDLGAAVTYEITALSYNTTGDTTLPADFTDGDVNALAVGDTGSDNLIAAEIWTNTSGSDVDVIYEITPTFDGCIGDPVEVTLTVQPEPSIADQTEETCSDVALDYSLTALVSGGTFTYTAESSDEINVPTTAANDRTTASGDNITDTYTNTTGVDVTVTYTVTPVGSNGCTGNQFDLIVTVQPEPVLATTLDATVCTEEVSGITLAIDPVIMNGTDPADVTYTVNSISFNTAGNATAPTDFTDEDGTDLSLAANNNGNEELILAEAWTNNTDDDVAVIYNITPTVDGCDGDPVDVTLTVEPKAELDDSNNTFATDFTAATGQWQKTEATGSDLAKYEILLCPGVDNGGSVDYAEIPAFTLAMAETASAGFNNEIVITSVVVTESVIRSDNAGGGGTAYSDATEFDLSGGTVDFSEFVRADGSTEEVGTVTYTLVPQYDDGTTEKCQGDAFELIVYVLPLPDQSSFEVFVSDGTDGSFQTPNGLSNFDQFRGNNTVSDETVCSGIEMNGFGIESELPAASEGIDLAVEYEVYSITRGDAINGSPVDIPTTSAPGILSRAALATNQEDGVGFLLQQGDVDNNAPLLQTTFTNQTAAAIDVYINLRARFVEYPNCTSVGSNGQEFITYTVTVQPAPQIDPDFADMDNEVCGGLTETDTPAGATYDEFVFELNSGILEDDDYNDTDADVQTADNAVIEFQLISVAIDADTDGTNGLADGGAAISRSTTADGAGTERTAGTGMEATPVNGFEIADGTDFTEFLRNTGSEAGTVTYTFRPQIDATAGAETENCFGATFDVVVVVEPEPVLTLAIDVNGTNPPAAQTVAQTTDAVDGMTTICDNNSDTFTLTPGSAQNPATGTVQYNVVIDNPGQAVSSTTLTGALTQTITDQAAGDVLFNAETFSNPGTTASVITFTFTPRIEEGTTDCPGEDLVYVLTVEPTPDVALLDANRILATETICGEADSDDAALAMAEVTFNAAVTPSDGQAVEFQLLAVNVRSAVDFADDNPLNDGTPLTTVTRFDNATTATMNVANAATDDDDTAPAENATEIADGGTFREFFKNTGNTEAFVVYSFRAQIEDDNDDNSNGTVDDCAGEIFYVIITVEPEAEIDFTDISTDYTTDAAARTITLTEAECGGTDGLDGDNDFAEYPQPANGVLLSADNVNGDISGSDNFVVRYEIVSIEIEDAADGTGNGLSTVAFHGSGLDGVPGYAVGTEFADNDIFLESYRNEGNVPAYFIYTLQAMLDDGTTEKCISDDLFKIIIPVEPIPDADFTDQIEWTGSATNRTLTSDIICGNAETDDPIDPLTDDYAEYSTTASLTLNAFGLNGMDVTVTNGRRVEFEITEKEVFTDAAATTAYTGTDFLFASDAAGTAAVYDAETEFNDGDAFQEWYRNQSGQVLYAVYTLVTEIETDNGTAPNVNDDNQECRYKTFQIIVPVQPIPEFDYTSLAAGYTWTDDATTARTVTSDIICGSGDVLAATSFDGVRNEHTQPVNPIVLNAVSFGDQNVIILVGDDPATVDRQVEFEILSVTFNTQADGTGTALNLNADGMTANDDDVTRGTVADGTGTPYAVGDEFDAGDNFREWYRNETDAVAYVIYVLQPQIEDETDGPDSNEKCQAESFRIVIPIEPIPDVEGEDAMGNDIIAVTDEDGFSAGIEWDSDNRVISLATECGSEDGVSPVNLTLNFDPFETPSTGNAVEYELVGFSDGGGFGSQFVKRFKAEDDYENFNSTETGYDDGAEFHENGGDITFTEYLINFGPFPVTVEYSFRPQIDAASSMTGDVTEAATATDSESCAGDVFTVEVTLGPIGQVSANVDESSKCAGDVFELEGNPVANFFTPSPFTHAWSIATDDEITASGGTPTDFINSTLALGTNATLMNATAQNATFSTTETGTVRVRYQGFDANGCPTAPFYLDLEVTSDFAITATPTIELCESTAGSGSANDTDLTGFDGDFTINAAGTPTVTWYNGQPSAGGTPLSSTSSMSATLGTNGILNGDLWAQLSNGGCVNETVVNFTINATPEAPTVADAAICAGDAAPTLTATAPTGTGIEINWYSDAALTTSVQSNSAAYTPTAAPAATTTYYVQTENGNCTSTVTEVTLTVNPLPTPALTAAPADVCAGETAVYTLTTPTGNAAAYEDTDWTISGGTITAGGDQSNFVTVEWGTAGTGTIDVMVTDTNGCSAAITQASIVINDAPVPTVTVTAVSCHGAADGGASATPTDGSAPYDFVWSDGTTLDNAATSAITGLSPNTHSVTVTDSEGCSTVSEFIVTEPAQLTAEITETVDAVCFDRNGSATVTAAGGTGPYTYDWSDDGAETPDNDSATESDLAPGSYSVTVTDANNCTAVANVTISEPDDISVTGLVSDDLNCDAVDEGAIGLMVNGGSPAYSYSWTLNGNAFAATTPSLSGLAGGVYAVTVTDKASCTATASFTVTQFAGFTAAVGTVTNETCNEANDGTATVTMTGGAAPFDFAWSNGNSDQTATGLSADAPMPYSVTVTDANGCSAVVTGVTVTQPAVLAVSFTENDVICAGASNGSAVANVTGGTANYTYTWSDGQNTQEAENLSAGVYLVTVTDMNGCEVIGQATIDDGTDPAVFAVTGDDVTACTDATANNTVTVGVMNSETGVTYTLLLDGTAQTPTVAGTGAAIDFGAQSTAGIYTVTATSDTGNCVSEMTGSVTLTIEDAPTVFAVTGGNVTVCEDANTGVTVGIANSQVGVTYTLFLGTMSTGQTISGDGAAIDFGAQTAAGTYTVVAVDDNNACDTDMTGSASLTITTLPVVQIDDATNVCEDDAAITLQGSDGTTDYTSGVFSGAGITNGGNNGTATFTPSAALIGVNTVTYTYMANGCSNSTTVDIEVFEAPTVSAGADQTVCADAAAVIISGSIGGGASSATWTTDGTGTFDNVNSPTTEYNPSPADITAGTVTLTLTTDANGECEAVNDALTLTITPNPTAAISGDNEICVGESSTLTASGGGTYLWEDGTTTTAERTVSPASTTVYSVLVTDNGCSSTAQFTVTVNELPTAYAGEDVEICNGASTTLTASGGDTYQWTDGPATATYSVSPTTTTTYTVIVTDANNCTDTDQVTVVVNDTPTATITTDAVNNAICAGESITLSASGGESYAWMNGPATADWTVSPTADMMYTVTVTDANGCADIETVSVTVNTAPTAGITVDETIDCAGGNEGELTATGGTSYEWSNGLTDATVTGLVAGTYTVTVTDANGCTDTETVTLTEPTELTATIIAQSDADCNAGTDGSATVAGAGGTMPYTYAWSDTSAGATLTAEAGTYTVTVTDANDCEAVTSVNIGEPNAIEVNIIAQTNVDCNGNSTGSVTLSATGGDDSYTYTFMTTDATPVAAGTIAGNVVSGLAAGTYTATATDGNGCTGTVSVTITQPTAALTAGTTGDALKCSGDNDGIIEVEAAGGTEPYTYEWEDENLQIVGTDEAVGGLAAGDYDVTVTDAKGCTITASAEVTQPMALALSGTTTDVDCNGAATGAIDLTVSGGTIATAAEFAWSNGATTEDLTALAAGTYTVTVTDDNDCTAEMSFTIDEPAALIAVASGTDETCTAADDATVTVTISGGTPATTGSAYLIDWEDDADQGTSIGSTATLNELAAGTYNVTVFDNNLCEATAQVIVGEPTALTLTLDSDDETCGAQNATVTSSAGGGTGMLTYLWSNGSTDQDLTNVSAGMYTLTVTDANGCTISVTETVNSSGTITATAMTVSNVSCNGGNDGAVSAVGSAGAAPYSYLWSNGSTDAVQTGLTQGTYNVTITDNNGCSASASAIVNQPDALTWTTVPSATDVTCNGGNDGAVTAVAAGGTPTVTYTWEDGDGNSVTDLSALTAGTYHVTATDSEGCTLEGSTVVNEPAAVSISGVTTDVLCNGSSTGAIDLTATGGTGALTYAWSNNAMTEDLSALAAGTYTVTVTDASSCTATMSFTLTQPNALTLAETSEDADCNGGFGNIVASASGGTEPFVYSVNNGTVSSPQQSNPIFGVPAGTYSLTVTDADFCTTTISGIAIGEPDALTATLNASTNPDCNGGDNGTIAIDIAGGTTPYDFAWNNGDNIEDLTGLTAGTYQVTVTDANGCTASLAAAVTLNEGTTVTAAIGTPTNVSCNGGADGTATASGGTTYLWSDGQTTATATGLTAGTYTVTVSDGNGCSDVASVNIVEPANAMTLSLAATDIDCHSGSDGTITPTVSNANGTVTFTVNGMAATLTAGEFTGLAAGDYTVVAAANGCTASENITVTQPAPLSATAAGTDPTTSGGTNGSATVTPAGGTTPYTFAWSTSPAQTDATATGLAAGTYTVTVTDANDCTTTATVTLGQPSTLVLTMSGTDAACNADNNGTASVDVTGGTPNYSYNWENAANAGTSIGTTASLTGLAAGTYNVTVTDANNATATGNYTVGEPTAIDLMFVTMNATCTDGEDGSVETTITGGTAPFDYFVLDDDNQSVNSGATDGTATVPTIELPQGDYTFIAHDANDCIYTETFTIGGGDNVAPTAICQDVTVTLDADGNGTLTAEEVDNESTDNCTVASLSVDQTAFTCADIANNPNTVTLTATDAAGLTGTCTANVTVEDASAPTSALCGSFFTVTLDAAGNGVMTAADIAATDNCSTAPTVAFFVPAQGPEANFDCEEAGTTQLVIAELADDNGNTTSCMVFVSVVDDTPPVAACVSDITVQLDAAGAATITTADTDDGSADVCSDVTLTLDNDAFDCDDVAAVQVVTMTVTDKSGNSATCTTNVTVEDNVSPTALCNPAVDVVLDATGNGTLTTGAVDNGSSDNCTPVTLSLDVTAFDCTAIPDNTTTVTMTVTDAYSNASTCTTEVTVIDNTLPDAVCVDLTDVQLDANGEASITPAQVGSGSTDACGVMTLALDVEDFTCANVGAGTVTLTVTDNNGNEATCTANVEIVDEVVPMAVCADDFTVDLDATGAATLTAAQIENGSTDACGIASTTIAPNALDCTNIDTPLAVTLTVTDNNGNEATCTTNVSAADVIAPTSAECGSATAFVLQLDAAGTATVPGTAFNAVDECGGTVTVNFTDPTDPTFGCADVSALQTVEATFTDEAGNTSAACAISVDVQDTVDPTAACLATFTVVLDSDGEGTIAADGSDIDDGSSDACGIQATSVDVTMFTCTDITAPVDVTLTVTDVNGNESTCVTPVTVADEEAPTALECNNFSAPIDLVLDANGMTALTAADLTVADNCTDPANVLITFSSTSSFTCADVGQQLVFSNLEDESGNDQSCMVVVNVVDNTAPAAICQATFDAILDTGGEATITTADIDNGSNDNCGIASLALDRTDFTCADIANNPTTVTLTVTDNNGLTSTCTSDVTVVDNTDPIALCKPAFNADLNAGGTASITLAQIDNGSSDVCSAVTTAIDVMNFDCSDIGPNDVTLTVTDASNNTATCVTVVTVRDRRAPTSTTCNNFSNPIVLNLDANGAAELMISQINVIDNCTAPANIIVTFQNDATFDCTEIGQQLVFSNLEDESGNNRSCMIIVDVQDNTAPTATCNATFTATLDAQGEFTLTTADIDNGSSDNCNVASLALDITEFTCADAANNPNTVTLTVTDDSGNTSTCTSDVTVTDAVAPTANCADDFTLALDANGDAAIIAADIDNGSSDVCSAVTTTIDVTDFDCADLGANTVTLTVTDAGGNDATCTTTVTITDETAPTSAACGTEITVDLNGSGTITLTSGLFAPTDNCSAMVDIDVTFTQPTDPTFDCEDAGTQQLVFADLTDASGNGTSCMLTVNIADGLAPNAVCVNSPYFVNLGTDGTAAITAADIDNGSNDNCTANADLTLSLDIFKFDCDDLDAPVTTELTVTDDAGNTATCTTDVTVRENIEPVVDICVSPVTVTVELDAAGDGTLNLSDIGNYEDNCTEFGDLNAAFYDDFILNGGNNLGASIDYDCNDLGAQTAVIVVGDESNNVEQCEFNINVTDPTGNCTAIPFTSNGDTNEAEERAERELDVIEGEVSITSVIAKPNPFSVRTRIEYVLNVPTEVNVSVYDLAGQLVTELSRGTQGSGKHAVTWEPAGDTAPGSYFVVIQTAEGARRIVQVQKVR